MNEFTYLLEKIHKIEYLAGCSIDDLLEKLASSWTLEPPKGSKMSTFSVLLKGHDE